ncbi:M55 family metallopeptidase [Streptomyces sp. NPDC004111]|uniref:M55 family metallopeptidase n=1 Tax=Streptomyces sp. NPDC004111 TaxID=3364690 RepID=UPI00368ADFD8
MVNSCACVTSHGERAWSADLRRCRRGNIAGLVEADDVQQGGRDYGRGRLMTAENVEAGARGVLTAGVTSALVIDAHCPRRDLLLKAPHAAVHLVERLVTHSAWRWRGSLRFSQGSSPGIVEDEGGLGDGADPAGVECDVLASAPAFIEYGHGAFAGETQATEGLS